MSTEKEIFAAFNAERDGVQFPIRLEDNWKQLGYSRKDVAKRAILKRLIEKEHYIIIPAKIFVAQNEMNLMVPSEMGALGRKEEILLSIEGFTKFKATIFLTKEPKRSEKVYFILNRVQNIVKIGFSIDPKRRLIKIEEGTIDDLELIGVVAGGRKEELILHKKFAAYRIKREWFQFSSEIKSYIESLKG